MTAIVKEFIPATPMHEHVYCNCTQELSILAQASCLTCHQTNFSSRELQNQIKDLDAQAAGLRHQATQIQIVLFLRERHKTQTDMKGNRIDTTAPNFWQNVRKAPRGEKTGIVRDLKAEARAMLEALD